MRYSSKTELSNTIQAMDILKIIPSGILVGSQSAKVQRIRPLSDATNKDLTFCVPRKDLDAIDLVKSTSASIVICEISFFNVLTPQEGQAFIFVKNAKKAFGEIIKEIVLFSTSSLLAEPSSYGKECVFYNVLFGPNVVLGDNILIGERSIIYANTTIYNDVQIGQNTVIHAGCSIGHPGLGPIGDTNEGWSQFPDLGVIDIGSNVNIGANCSIAQSPLGSTVIEDGVQIANMVNIGHNAYIEKNAVITSLSMIARGRIGSGAWIAPGVTIRPGMNVGKKAVVGVGSVVTKDIPCETTVIGVPAKKK